MGASTPQEYESWASDMHHWKICSTSLENLQNYRSGRFAFFITDVGQLFMTHMLVVAFIIVGHVCWVPSVGALIHQH